MNNAKIIANNELTKHIQTVLTVKNHKKEGKLVAEASDNVPAVTVASIHLRL